MFESTLCTQTDLVENYKLFITNIVNIFSTRRIPVIYAGSSDNHSDGGSVSAECVEKETPGGGGGCVGGPGHVVVGSNPAGGRAASRPS